MATVTFDEATRLFPGSERPAVDKLNIDVGDGEFLVLLGASGRIGGVGGQELELEDGAVGAGSRRGVVFGKSDKTASAPIESPVHPIQLVATIYHSIGLDPASIIYNHLNQPREMVQADIVDGLLA